MIQFQLLWDKASLAWMKKKNSLDLLWNFPFFCKKSKKVFYCFSKRIWIRNLYWDEDHCSNPFYCRSIFETFLSGFFFNGLRIPCIHDLRKPFIENDKWKERCTKFQTRRKWSYSRVLNNHGYTAIYFQEKMHGTCSY